MTLTDTQLQEIRGRASKRHPYDQAFYDSAHRDVDMLLSALSESRQREQRAVEALRAGAIVKAVNGNIRCEVCRSLWDFPEPNHNSVELLGITGPCPAELRKEETT